MTRLYTSEEVQLLEFHFSALEVADLKKIINVRDSHCKTSSNLTSLMIKS